MIQRVHLYYSGRVQGVGFRYTVRDMAIKLNIPGWVRNLPDRRVELLAEAEETVLKDFLGSINECFSRYIQGAQTSWEPAVNDLKDFTIKL